VLLLERHNVKQLEPGHVSGFLLSAAFVSLWFLGTAHCQEPELTQEEQWATQLAIYHSQDWLSWAQKMPVDVTLSTEWSDLNLEPRIVDADSDRPLPVHLANWQAPTPSPSTLQCQGVCVSYSSQGAASLVALTGKRIAGVEIIQATVCAPRQVSVPGGLIYQQANALGIQTIASKVGMQIVNNTVSLNWRAIVMDTVIVGLGIGSGLTVGGVVSSSINIQRALTLGHLASDALPKLFSHGAPDPSAFLNTVLDGNTNLNLSAPGCTIAMLAGVYRKGAVLLTQPTQLLP